MLQHVIISSPLGPLLLEASTKGLTRVAFGLAANGVRIAAQPTQGSAPWTGTGTVTSGTAPADNAHLILQQAIAQLNEFFANQRTTFDLPLAPKGTSFQQQVWAELSRIEFGKTRCYGDIAARLGKPKAARAVGMANGRNPLPIIIPCHRVIGSDGSLTGFSGGMDLKRKLLQHEGQGCKQPSMFSGATAAA